MENQISVIIQKVEKAKAKRMLAKNSYNYTKNQKTFFLYDLEINFSQQQSQEDVLVYLNELHKPELTNLKVDPDWNIYEKQTNKINCLASQLQNEQKTHIISLHDEKQYATTDSCIWRL